MRSPFAALLCCASLVNAQQMSIAPVRPTAPIVIRPYMPVTVPDVRTGNSPRLASLIRAGALYLTAQDAIALALENNIDIEIARYNPLMSEWRLVRAEAGGALPGVPSAASQAGTVAAGQGVAGSQAAAGIRIAGTGSNAGQGANATISQIGPVTQTLDPSFSETSTFSHTTTPQANTAQSLTTALVSDSRAHTGQYQQGFLSGGNVTVRFTDNYLKENSPTNLLNPSTANVLSVSAQHNLLRGFGTAVNARTITVSKRNLAITDLNFKVQVINLTSQVLSQYYNLAASWQDVRARRNTAEVARTFFNNVKRQIELGAVAPPEAINAESQAVNSEQALSASEATLRQQEVRLKNLISRTGPGDPLLTSVRIIPVDPIVLPPSDSLPPLEEMVKSALAVRADLEGLRAGEISNEISALGTRNGVLPNLQGFVATSNAGLAGTARTVVRGPIVDAPDPYFAGGVGTSLGQVFRRNYPTQRAGAFFQTQLRNNQAQADYNIDQLQLRQNHLSTQKNLNQVQVDLANYVIALQQARARYEAAIRNRALQEELFRSEQRKFELGSSIPYNVIQAQRDLINAQSSEISALTSWSSARVALDQTLGRTLEVNGVGITQVQGGALSRTSVPVEAPPPGAPKP